MKHCPACGASVTETDSICPQCKNTLPREQLLCPGCKRNVLKEWKVCPDCGTKLAKVLGYLCSKCGMSVEEGWNNCPACGAVLNNDTRVAYSSLFTPVRSANQYEYDRTSAHVGYYSKDDKDKFKSRATILAVLFTIGSFVIPVLALVIYMFTIGFQMNIAIPDHGSVNENHIWYIEEQIEIGAEFNDSIIVKRIDLRDKSDPQTVTELTEDDYWLLPDSHGLWLISSTGLDYYSEDTQCIETIDEYLWTVSAAFLYRGRPSIAQETLDGCSLKTFEDGSWNELLLIDYPWHSYFSGNSGFQVISDTDILHLFFSTQEGIYYSKAESKEGEWEQTSWEVIVDTDLAWHVVMNDDEPNLFYVPRDNRQLPQTIEAIQYTEGEWIPGSSYDVGLVMDFGAYPLTYNDEVALLVQSFPGTVKLIVVDYQGEIISEERYGSWGFFSYDLIVMGFLVNGIALLFPFVLAVILSHLMEKHRNKNHVGNGMTMPYASLTRRSIAQGVDLIVIWAFSQISYLGLFLSESGIEAMTLSDPSDFPLESGLMLLGMVWAVACFILFSYTEGKWGTTPGKWLLGIRVLDTDLQSCGFGRGLVRNLLEIVDGFANFILGILFIAFTSKRQRVGDIAAKTVVVYVRDSAEPIYSGHFVERKTKYSN